MTVTLCQSGQRVSNFVTQFNSSSVELYVLVTILLKMKQQTHDKLNVWRTRKKSEPQMGYDFTIVCHHQHSIFQLHMRKLQ